MSHPGLRGFVGGDHGKWRVESTQVIRGDALPACQRIDIVESAAIPSDPSWVLRGVPGHTRYTTRAEQGPLREVQPPLGRPEATAAALIPIRKSDAWWELAQDERRAIMEERSHHIRIGMEYLPAVARRLYHCRDLGEPFDFLTWFEFHPSHAPAFADLLDRLRASEEWRWVDRELEMRLVLDA